MVIIPLLIETKSIERFNRVLLVDTTESLQLERVTKRDKISCDLIKKIIRSQATRDERLNYADDIIVNNDDIPDLDKSIITLHEKYLTLSSKKYE